MRWFDYICLNYLFKIRIAIFSILRYGMIVLSTDVIIGVQNASCDS